MPMTAIEISPPGPGLFEITRDAAEALGRMAGAAGRPERRPEGLLTVFVRHTSCSLVIQENADPTARADLEAFFKRLVPPATSAEMGWMTHIAEGPDDMPAHIKAALTQTSIGVPVAEGRMQLGAWQGLYLFEHRSAPPRRRILLQFLAG